MIYHTHTFATEAEAEAFAAGVEFAHRENLIVEAIEPAEFDVVAPEYEKWSHQWAVLVTDYDSEQDEEEGA
jgi:hypothetical protein